MSDKAVLYLRSSKDRHDVSIDAQRRDLNALAAQRKLTIVAEFADVVESGKDEDRPGFQSLYTALRSRERNWRTILVLDTSRIARRVDIAVVFEEREAKPRGVEVVYKSLPDMEPVMRQFLKRQLQAVDELHSMLSRQKGLAGMRENVQQGWRAGGRAPHGYQLHRESTGAIRDGQPVLKSRLELGPAAAAVSQYLQLRAAGTAGISAARQAGLDVPPTTRISIEWNALTYAGCTVWNVHNERIGGRHVGNVKRRARTEWVIKDKTHPALITRAEAEVLLQDLERRTQERRYRTPATYLLTGILVDGAGERWHGNRDGPGRTYYRRGRASVRTELVDRAVVDRVLADLKSDDLVKRLLRSAQRLAEPDVETDTITRAWSNVAVLDRKIASLMGSLADTTAKRPLLEQIERWEREREKIKAGMVALETRLKQARAAAAITQRDIEKVVAGLCADMVTDDREALKDHIAGICDRITLDPGTLQLGIHYQIPAATGDFVASPRRHVEIPRLTALSLLRLAA